MSATLARMTASTPRVCKVISPMPHSVSWPKIHIDTEEVYPGWLPGEALIHDSILKHPPLLSRETRTKADYRRL